MSPGDRGVKRLWRWLPKIVLGAVVIVALAYGALFLYVGHLAESVGQVMDTFMASAQVVESFNAKRRLDPQLHPVLSGTDTVTRLTLVGTAPKQTGSREQITVYYGRWLDGAPLSITRDTPAATRLASAGGSFSLALSKASVPPGAATAVLWLDPLEHLIRVVEAE